MLEGRYASDVFQHYTYCPPSRRHEFYANIAVALYRERVPWCSQDGPITFDVVNMFEDDGKACIFTPLSAKNEAACFPAVALTRYLASFACFRHESLVKLFRVEIGLDVSENSILFS